jgi:hypothetical protein
MVSCMQLYSEFKTAENSSFSQITCPISRLFWHPFIMALVLNSRDCTLIAFVHVHFTCPAHCTKPLKLLKSINLIAAVNNEVKSLNS